MKEFLSFVKWIGYIATLSAFIELHASWPMYLAAFLAPGIYILSVLAKMALCAIGYLSQWYSSRKGKCKDSVCSIREPAIERPHRKHTRQADQQQEWY